MIDLTSVRQGRDESIQEYFKKFKDIKNRCFNLSLSEKDLVDLALAGLRSSYREKLDGSSFYSTNQLQAKALSQETKFKKEKDTYKSHRSNTHIVEYDSIHRTMKTKRYMLQSSFGPPRPNHVLVHLLSRLKRIGKKR